MRRVALVGVKGTLEVEALLLAVLSHHAQLRSLAQGTLKAGHRPELQRKPSSMSMVSSVFPSLLFWNLEPCSQNSVFQSNWTNKLWSRLLYPLQMKVSLYPVLQTKDTRFGSAEDWQKGQEGETAGFFWEQFSLCPTRKLTEHSEEKNLVLGMRKHCSNKFQPLNPSWLCHFSWWLFIAF